MVKKSLGKTEAFKIRSKGSVRELCLEELTIETGNMRNTDTLRTLELTSTGIGTVAKTKFVHLCNHCFCTAFGLRTTLRKKSKRTDPGGNKKHCRTILTSSYTSSATYTGSCIHTFFSPVM